MEPIRPIQPTEPELFHSWEQFAGFDVKEAKDGKRLLGVVRDLLIMKMENSGIVCPVKPCKLKDFLRFFGEWGWLKTTIFVTILIEHGMELKIFWGPNGPGAVL